MMMRFNVSTEIAAFIAESNRIEGIHRPPTAAEGDAHMELFGFEEVTIARLENFVDLVAHAKLRRSVGMNVRVGGHLPPPGGLAIEAQLRAILTDVAAGNVSAWEAHLAYETLHPFMDGNGRSGRALWAWQMLRDGGDPFSLGFLHRFYYQTLAASRRLL